MEPEKKLTPLEEKWREEAKKPRKTTLDDAYTQEGKVAEEGLSSLFLTLSPNLLDGE